MIGVHILFETANCLLVQKSMPLPQLTNARKGIPHNTIKAIHDGGKKRKKKSKGMGLLLSYLFLSSSIALAFDI
jgi:hypothetical protein